MTQDPDDGSRTCAILEALAGQYPRASAEHQALRDAAAAYLLVRQSEVLHAAFEKLKSTAADPLTPEMTARLRALGIDPAV